MRVLLCALIGCMFSVASGEADIYRTVDENGVVCYTDAPFDRKSEKVQKTAPASKAKVRKEKPVYETRKSEYNDIVKDKAEKYALEPSLIHAVIKAESNGNPYAVSKKGAKGLMQLMPSTASDMRVSNPFDPVENIDGGTRYLKQLIERFNGDLTLALAAYNAGPKTVEKTGRVPQIAETKYYVNKVLSLYNGSAYLPVNTGSSSGSGGAVKERPEKIYKMSADDGTILFTNLPVDKRFPRF